MLKSKRTNNQLLFNIRLTVRADGNSNFPPAQSPGRWAQYRKVHYSAGFDKIHYPGLTIIRRLFFRQTIFAWQVFESAFEWQKNISVDTSNREIPVTADKPTYRQTGKKTRFLFYWTRKPFSFFMWDKFFDRNFFTIWEIISDAEKDEDNFFTFSFFVFIRQPDCFSCGQKFLIQRKMTKVFSLFS